MHRKSLYVILFLILCAVFAGCAQPSEVTEIVENISDEPLPNIMLRDELCAQTRSFRDKTTTHEEFASWISTNNAGRASDLSANARHAAMIYADSQLALDRRAETPEYVEANASLRNISFELMENYYDPEGNLGNPDKTCPLWDTHRNGGLSSSELFETFKGDGGSAGFREGYSWELGLLIFAYEHALRADTDSDDQDTRNSRIEEMFASTCNPVMDDDKQANGIIVPTRL